MIDVAEQQQTGEVTAEELEAWRQGEVLEMATRQNFPQIWRDPDTGRYIDFAAIVDEDQLKRVSDQQEDKYLQKISEKRQRLVSDQSSATQQEAVRQFERSMSQLDLYYLTKYVIGAYPDLVFHFHYFMCESIAHPPPGNRSLHEFPRDAYKSTVLVIGDNVQLIINNPNSRILIKSNAQDNAGSKLTETKNAFIIDRPNLEPGSEEYQRCHPYHAGCLSLKEQFPEHVPKTVAQQGSGSAWTTPAKTSAHAEATITAAGVGTSKTSQHYDIIKGDDFWDEKSVTSPEVMSKARGEMNRLEYLLASPAQGRIEYTGTRFAHDDPTTDLQKDPTFKVTICSGVTPEGRALFPENLPLWHMYSKFCTQRYDFSCQIMLNPSDDSRGFSRDWIRYMRGSELREAYQNSKLNYQVRLLTDAATDDKSSSDEAAILAVAFDDTGRKVVLEAVEEKMQPSDFISELYRLGEKYRPEFVVRQKTAIETTIMSFINKEQQDRRQAGKMTLRFVDYSLRKREKKTRITAALQPSLQAGTLMFDPEMEKINELEQELVQHPNSQQDHLIDALAEIDDPVVSRIPQGLKKQESVEEQYIPDQANIESLFCRQKARDAFATVRNENQTRKLEIPGTRVS